MDIDTRIIKRLDDLLDLGQKVLSTRREPSAGHMTSDFVDVQLANQWLTSTSSLLYRVFGESSIHYTRLQTFLKDYPKWPDVNQAFGVLNAAKDDYEKDSLFDVKQLIEADLFDEFLEQAEYLYESGYHQAAAVIAGSVLEDGIRKLCVRNNIELSEKPKLDWMNAQLVKRGMYSKLIQKKITSLADLRNSAAHGKWTEFEKSDVEEMLRNVRDFMERNYV